MKQVSIIAATFYGNRGAEAMLSTTIAQLRKSNNETLHFNVFSYYPEADEQLINDENISIYSSTPKYLVAILLPFALLYRLSGLLKLNWLQKKLPTSVQALAKSKVLICLAGVSFVAGRTKFLPFNIATILPAMLLQVPVVKFAQAVGPFNSALNRFFANAFLGRCRQIFSRGEQTQQYLSALLGFKENYQRADDVAFLFEPDFCLSQEGDGLKTALQNLTKNRDAHKKIIGICPSIVVAKRAESAGWDYANFIVELITELSKKGFAIALYPNATRGEDMDKTHNNDLPLLAEIKHNLPISVEENVTVFSGSLNAAQIHTLINSCDIHIVSRFHAMVASLSSSIPVMVIGWSHKYLEVMESFEQGDMVIDYGNGNLDLVLKNVDKIIVEHQNRKTNITKHLSKVRQLSKIQIDYIMQLITSDL